MINRGVSGELSAQSATRIKNEVRADGTPTWCYGRSEPTMRWPSSARRARDDDYRYAGLAQGSQDRLVLVGLQYVDQMARDDHYKAVGDLLRKLAAKETSWSCAATRPQQFLARAESGGGGLVPDEFQRTEAGYVCLAQYMARAITLGIFRP